METTKEQQIQIEVLKKNTDEIQELKTEMADLKAVFLVGKKD